jgi:hypothetical protein
MISRPIGSRFTSKWASATLVIGSTVAVLASPLSLGASSAAPAPVTPATSVTVASGGGSSNPAGATSFATLGVSYTPTASDASIYYTVTSGPDASNPYLSGTLCTPVAAGSATCKVTNTGSTGSPAVAAGTAGTDQVTVFASNDGSSTFSSADAGAAAATSVIFAGPLGSLHIVPLRNPATHTLTTEDGTCEVYKVSALDNASRPAGNQTIPILVTASQADPTGNSFTGYVVDPTTGLCTTPLAPGYIATGSTLDNGTTHAQTTSGAVIVGDDGTGEFGLVSTKPGTGTVEVCNNSAILPATDALTCTGTTVNDTDSVTWAAGGKDAVATLAATPAASSGYTGTTATYTVKATDSGGNPVEGVTVNEETTNGPGTVTPPSCPGTTLQDGTVTCSLTNDGTAGTDAETFWVDNDSTACSHGTGPDSCEPQTSATAQFTSLPNTDSAHITLSCPDLDTFDGAVAHECRVPTDQKAVTFTATVLDKTSGAPVSGAIVSFTALGATVTSSTSTPSSGTVTTGTDGTAKFTVTNASPSNADTVSVSAKVGSIGASNSETAEWLTRKASTLTTTPSVQSVTKGGAVSVKVQIFDQFGAGVAAANHLTYFVTGRNLDTDGSATTDSTGTATISYTDTDTSSNPAATSDTIAITDAATTPTLSGSATVEYLNGTSTASTVAVDTSGSGTSDALCGASGHTAPTGVALAHQTEVCAVVKNAGSEALAGKTVVFTVSAGQVAAHSGLSSTSTTSYTATTDANGVAFADVTSTKSGAQTVTAAADAVTGAGTVTYTTPAIATARNIAVTPSPATVTAGTPEKFTFTVTDQYGNGVPSVSVLATQSGPGILSGGNTSVITGPDGTASVQLTTQASDTGAGSVTGNITGGNVCGSAAGSPVGTTAGNCTTTATYTIAAPITPSSLTVAAAPGGTVGTEELVAAIVKNSDGSPAVHQVVRYTISGANSAHGAVVTNAKGNALFAFDPTHAGSNTVTAYDDVNDNQVQDPTEPHGVGTVLISKPTEKPTIRLTSGKGNVTIHVTAHPSVASAKVTYYVKHLGKFTEIGAGETGHSGTASATFVEGKGVTYTFRAKVTGKGGVKTGTSKAKSIKVKK